MCIYYMWVPVISGVLLRPYELGLWPNDPIRGCLQVWGWSTKVVTEISLKEELKVIYEPQIYPRWKVTSEPLSEVVWNLWILVNSTGKVSNGCIRDLGFNPRLHQNWLVSWFDDKELLSGADAIGWNSLKKKKR